MKFSKRSSMWMKVAIFAGAGPFTLTLSITPALAQDVTAGAQIYKRCVICHSTRGKNAIGPHLNGVVGRKVGGVPRYAYSKAMVGRPMVWNRETLDSFLLRPQVAFPGTTMNFSGISNATDRKNLIAYLTTLK